jgi:hypothetical protein
MSRTIEAVCGSPRGVLKNIRLFFAFISLSMTLKGRSAIDATTRQVDENVCLFEFFNPTSQVRSVPCDTSPGRRNGPARENNNRVPFRMKMPRQDIPNLSAASRKNNAKWTNAIHEASSSAVRGYVSAPSNESCAGVPKWVILLKASFSQRRPSWQAGPVT